MKKIKNSISEIIVLIFGLIILIGSMSLFSACEPMTKNGMEMWMNCHNAQVGITVCGAVIAVLAVITVFLKGKAKAVLDLALAAAGVVTVLLPTVIINTCMRADMQCNSVMKPCAVLLGALVVITAVIGAIINFKKKD